ncbi:MAG: DUF488 domain-containing protein [Sulfobacillus acidophilus]|uniref:DUF488 domain-containing protein n=1 Tax=Sulfobacillus acidophilus TaxID=53633 RepID=A0A2T2WEG6_9FIRM|nr:MAG: DUF488 domain-containing protein [Sulfobacillus acidophilus]
MERTAMEITLGRIHKTSSPRAVRILVDRLWPRGIAKANAPWNLWLQDVAPSTALRRWYGHDPERAAEFRQRYWEELEQLREHPAMAALLQLAIREPVMLLTASKDIEYSQLPVLRDFLLTFEKGTTPPRDPMP